MANDKQATILDLDAMMDIEMDNVETLPDFVTPPNGDYMLKVTECKSEKYKSKAKDNKPASEGARIRIQYAIEKTIEVAANELPVKDGSMFSESFMATEEGLKYFKRQAMNIMNVSDLAGAKMKDVMDGLKDQLFKARITVNKNSEGFENVRVRPVHEAAAE